MLYFAERERSVGGRSRSYSGGFLRNDNQNKLTKAAACQSGCCDCGDSQQAWGEREEKPLCWGEGACGV